MALESTGIANYEGRLLNAAVTYGDGTPQTVVEGATASCSKDLILPIMFIPVGGKARGCLLFPPSGSRRPTASSSRSRPCPSRPAGSGTSGEAAGSPAAGAGVPVGEFPDNTEEAFHQPPKPAEAGMDETITLTGTNLGIRMKVTVTGTETVRAGSERCEAVNLRLENTGVAIHDDEFREATVTYADGDPQALVKGVKAGCSNGFDKVERIDVGETVSGRLLFPASGLGAPSTFQMAFELIPVTAGGIWKLG